LGRRIRKDTTPLTCWRGAPVKSELVINRKLRWFLGLAGEVPSLTAS
jgi:hypothetical protein